MSNLVIQTAFLGDLLLSIPLLKYFRKLYPRHHLIILCRKGFGDIFVKLNLVDEAIEVDKTQSDEWKSAVNSLKRINFDTILCPHESLRTHLLVWQLKANKKIGFKKLWNFLFFDKRVQRPMHLPDAMRQLSLLGIEDEELQQNLLQMSESFDNSQAQKAITNCQPIPSWASMNIRQELLKINNVGEREIKKPMTFIAPGSVWETKKWTKEGYRDLVKMLLDEGNEVCFVGSKNEYDLSQEIIGDLEAQNKCGQTSLYETLNLFAYGKALFTNDSGPQHLAAAVGLPTVSVFGPTTLKLGYRPWQENVRVVEKDLSCRPCGKHGGKTCPIKTHECMRSVKAPEVFEAYKELTF